MFVGALVPTFLISRLLLWLLKRWDGGYVRYVVANAISGIASVVLAAFGNADGGSPRWDMGLIYLAPQAVWLVIDLFGYRGRQARATETF